ncbi:ammonium transporter [Methylocystis sp. MJC1]|uniref:ammonium transporter n=1 Tax=Methylocystis sp. MJC1 TaxID=2654282 RepID=UPI0013EC249E|nr:ammonium transporter [Methylocystis sp. MJC1]KAF2989342.1 Ammonia channel [Methylocystis sp. MJC1]MBU6526907.1 ammonium transporter [Methylocystis sp. MJC1]UZX13343.1 ammonium transporter [Methylocystis sp. MJC1]
MKKPLLALAGALLATPALAQDAPKIDGADTSFMIVATALVLMMTLPGLALFYSGMVRKKNVLATMAQSLIATAVVSLLWIAIAYSLVFSGDGPLIGDAARVLLSGVGIDTVSPLAKTIPEILFMAFQMTFAVITCALVGGSVAERMKFSAFIVFSVVWLFIVYVPSAHWVWGGGFLQKMGLLDFAGGTVVHINAGVAGLVCALVMGNRVGFGRENLSPFDVSLAVVGTGLLWVGWFGFNGGSALGANSRAVFAIVATHLAACSGALVWSGLEWLERGKPSVLGVISGAVAGLGTITPASGYVLPWHGVVIGLIAGGVCYWFCTVAKHKFNYDDTLDVFGVHGVGGIMGTLMAGVFATRAITASDSDPGVAGLLEGDTHQFVVQAIGVGVTIGWCVIGTLISLKIVSLFTSLRVSGDDEREGLDIALHGEALHHQ